MLCPVYHIILFPFLKNKILYQKRFFGSMGEQIKLGKTLSV